jgi:transposase InsO family protein
MSMADDSDDKRRAKGLVRYQVISAYLALDPPRGERGPLLSKLAKKVWTDADGEPMKVSAETLRAWVRHYRQGGLEALEDKPRPQRGVQVLSPEQVELACQLKREVPERSLDRIIRIMEEMKLAPLNVVRRSTLHRALKQEGLSARHNRITDRHDLDRFEAAAANDLWQSDMLTGPWLPDPQRPGKMRRAYLYAFIDDHSRMLLHGRFSFKGDLPALELVLRRCLQKYGVARVVYYDNGKVYRSHHMRHIVASLGMHPIVFTKSYRPMGHGKIEALNRFIRSAFLAELKASKITTLDALNEAFIAWADVEYNRKVHSETGEAPRVRWRTGIERIKYADEEKLRLAFLWTEKRTPDKSGVFSLFGTRYQVGPELARRRIELRYDPEQLDELEVWHQRRFMERVRPFEVQPNRRPKPEAKQALPSPDETPTTADWLGHLVEQRRETSFIEPSPQALSEQAMARRSASDQAIVDLFDDRLDPRVVAESSIRAFLGRYGPFDTERAADVIDRMLEHGPNDHHVDFYLEAIHKDQRKGPSK